MSERIISVEDGTERHAEPDLWRQPNGRLYDLPTVNLRTLRENIDPSEFSLWRYRAALPFVATSQHWRELTLGEGATPLVRAGKKWPGLRLKLEFAMPTLSFKDRGAAVMVAKAAEWNVRHVAADTSGNAGTALAAYAARAGMSCDIFVPASASSGKLVQMEKHGATVHRIRGQREAATKAAQRYVADNSIFYASHIYNPYFYEGTKTVAYELWEQLGFTAPDRLYLPVGHGTLLLGVYKGFMELLSAGLISKLPVLYAAQAGACAPVAEAYARAEENISPVDSTGTVAEGIAISAPPRGSQILHAIRATGGDVLRLTDEDIMQARRRLALMGFFVEPTAAVTFAAYQKACHAGSGDENAVISVVPLCGAGLKAPNV